MMGKILNNPVIVITGSVFQEGNKYYPQVLLRECVYRSVGIDHVYRTYFSHIFHDKNLSLLALKQKFLIIWRINEKYINEK